MGTPATVGVDDDLAAGETGVTLGTADDEASRGLDVVDGVVVEQVGGDDLLDDLLHDLGAEVLGGDLLGVLGGDDDGVDTEGTVAPPSFLYSTVTWVLESGRSQPRVPSRRAADMARLSLCESMRVMGIISGSRRWRSRT